MFPAEQDRLYLNRGDGTFRDVTQAAGLVRPDGKGLGIVAADFDGSRRLGLFVANDTRANFFFVNQTPQRGLSPVFDETALLSGIAVGDYGNAQSCMGVACGDVNGDGRPDVFVTNFYGEPNNLFVQDPGQVFVDQSRESGLRNPGFDVMGWGTQMLDGDLDGWLDLAVANGHLNDFSYKGTPYKMPPHYYRNLGQGRFQLVPGASLGAYFQRRSLGRAMARLDWNRDGKDDLCITHIHRPAALLENQTPAAGHFLAVKLCGGDSGRDAIGTTVRVSAGGRRTGSATCRGRRVHGQ